MKRIVEESGCGLEAMLGEKICLFCSIYIYTGKLSGVNDTHLELEDAKIVYETGPLASGEWEDAQPLSGEWRVQLSHIESWGPAKC